MGGHSGTRVARHTPILLVGGNRFAVTKAQLALVARCKASKTGVVFLRGPEVRTAEILQALHAGVLTDDGSVVLSGHVDGERWSFKLKEGVST